MKGEKLALEGCGVDALVFCVSTRGSKSLEICVGGSSAIEVRGGLLW